MGGGLTVVDLFCGAGGLSLGFSRAGFDVVWSADLNVAAVATYRRNLGDHVAVEAIGPDTALPAATVIAGGPPCQGFSSAGMRRAADHRNSLVGVFAELIARHRPHAFVFENVEGFLTAEGGARVFDLLRPTIAAGYRVHLRKVNAANYGVPQHRKRVIGIGGLGWSPTFPEPTHSAHGAPGAALAGRHLPLTPSLADAIAGLPAASPQNGAVDPLDHSFAPLKGADLERALALRMGETMRDLPPSLWHQSYVRRANRRVMDGTPSERRGGAPAGIRRLRADEPSKAITGGARSEFLHPTEARNLTIRECARIQTFPDDFVFEGSPGERLQLIGNAVPPRLAFAIASHLMADIGRVREADETGGLLSFVPTLSEGMSPALQSVTDSVRAVFAPPRGGVEQPSLWP